jgi:mRNA interferase RelE/StbE
LTNTATKMLEEISDRRIRKKIGERIDELANDPELQGNL